MTEREIALRGEPARALRRELEALLAPPSPAHELLYGMLRYQLGWVDARFQPVRARAGKRVRARLALLTCQAEGMRWEPALPAAAAVELLHAFSLVHDDIEDESPLRHGRKSLWAQWDVPLALNAGDALHSLAHQVLLRLGRLDALELFAEASIKLCQGQHLDLSRAGRLEEGLEGYFTTIEGKTAALIALSAELGALAGGAGEGRRRAYREYGRRLGLAYQIQDDWLGAWGAEEVTGKPVGEDLRRRKLTYPAAHAWERLEEAGRAELRSLWEMPRWEEETMERARALLARSGAEEATRRAAAQHARAAEEALPPASPQGDSAALRVLAELPGRLAGRAR